jgi:hypothetical protein
LTYTFFDWTGKQLAPGWFVSPTQINLQTPDDTATAVVTTAAGSFDSDVNDRAAIAPTAGTPGNSGNRYDYIGPTGGLPFTSRPLKAAVGIHPCGGLGKRPALVLLMA